MFLRNVKWDITKRCFLGCYFCLNAKERKLASLVELTYEEKKRVVDELARCGVKRIQLLDGEPLYSDRIFDLLDYIGYKGIKVGINTNGVMLSEANIKRILNANCVDDIIISLDGLEKLHNKIRAANIFNIIIDNLNTLIKLKKQKNVQLTVGVNTVLTGENTEDIYELLYVLDGIGIDYWHGLELVKFDTNEKTFTLDEIIEILKKLGQIQQEVSLIIKPKFTFPFIVQYVNITYGFKLYLAEHFCGAGLTFAYIDWSGRFYPCDRALPTNLNKDIYKNLKNHKLYLNKTSLDKCITSDLFKAFSFIYADETIKAKACIGCPYHKKICYPCTVLLKNMDTDKAYVYCLEMKQRIFTEWIQKFKSECLNDEYVIPENVILYKNTSTMYLFDVKLNNIYEIEDNLIKAILVSLYNNSSKNKSDIFTEVLFSPHTEINVFDGYESFVTNFTTAFTDMQQKGVIYDISKTLL